MRPTNHFLRPLSLEYLKSINFAQHRLWIESSLLPATWIRSLFFLSEVRCELRSQVHPGQRCTEHYRHSRARGGSTGWLLLQNRTFFRRTSWRRGYHVHRVKTSSLITSAQVTISIHGIVSSVYCSVLELFVIVVYSGVYYVHVHSGARCYIWVDRNSLEFGTSGRFDPDAKGSARSVYRKPCVLLRCSPLRASDAAER